MGWTRACGSAFAQRGQDHADVGRRHHQRVPSPALARDRWQAGLPRLRLHHLLRLPAVGGPAALTLQGLSRRLLDPLGHAVRAPQAAAADLSARRRRLAVRTMGSYLARWRFTAQKPLRRAYEQWRDEVRTGWRRTIRPFRPRPGGRRARFSGATRPACARMTCAAAAMPRAAGRRWCGPVTSAPISA
jgi:hypothetical protein